METRPINENDIERLRALAPRVYKCYKAVGLTDHFEGAFGLVTGLTYALSVPIGERLNATPEEADEAFAKGLKEIISTCLVYIQGENTPGDDWQAAVDAISPSAYKDAAHYDIDMFTLRLLREISEMDMEVVVKAFTILFISLSWALHYGVDLMAETETYCDFLERRLS